MHYIWATMVCFFFFKKNTSQDAQILERVLGLSSLQRPWIYLENLSVCDLFLLMEVVCLTSRLLERYQHKKWC